MFGPELRPRMVPLRVPLKGARDAANMPLVASIWGGVRGCAYCSNKGQNCFNKLRQPLKF
eukprot:13813-Amphidinium_carterae.1